MMEHNLDINNDKICRLNLQIILKKDIPQNTIHEIMQ